MINEECFYECQTRLREIKNFMKQLLSDSNLPVNRSFRTKDQVVNRRVFL